MHFLTRIRFFSQALVSVVSVVIVCFFTALLEAPKLNTILKAKSPRAKAKNIRIQDVAHTVFDNSNLCERTKTITQAAFCLLLLSEF